jgi:hypothetical protein
MPFLVTKYINDNIQINVFDLEVITDGLRQFIDDNICQICVGEHDNLQNIKSDLKRRLDRWNNDNNKIMGAIAEFFAHLYLKHYGYRQECLFLNLEENSLKKGFDGVYSIEEDLWFMESKSGSVTTNDITHASKVRDAFSDVKNKITTNVSNNPWLNAYNHARVVGTKKKLRDDLKRLSDDFINHSYQTIDDKNIIPCATIFLNGTWQQQNHNEIIQSVKNISTLQGKNIHIVCITQNSYEMFMRYLES